MIQCGNLLKGNPKGHSKRGDAKGNPKAGKEKRVKNKVTGEWERKRKKIYNWITGSRV